MRKCELELIRAIKESEDPEKAMVIAIDILQRVCAGEDEKSIAASYGISLAEEQPIIA